MGQTILREIELGGKTAQLMKVCLNRTGTSQNLEGRL